jgi:hypothetical protein
LNLIGGPQGAGKPGKYCDDQFVEWTQTIFKIDGRFRKLSPTRSSPLEMTMALGRGAGPPHRLSRLPEHLPGTER